MNAPIRPPSSRSSHRKRKKKKLGFTVRSSQIVFNEGKRKRRRRRRRQKSEQRRWMQMFAQHHRQRKAGDPSFLDCAHSSFPCFLRGVDERNKFAPPFIFLIVAVVKENGPLYSYNHCKLKQCKMFLLPFPLGTGIDVYILTMQGCAVCNNSPLRSPIRGPWGGRFALEKRTE